MAIAGFRRLPNTELWQMLLREHGFEQMHQNIRTDLNRQLGRVLNSDEYRLAFGEIEKCIDRLVGSSYILLPFPPPPLRLLSLIPLALSIFVLFSARFCYVRRKYSFCTLPC